VKEGLISNSNNKGKLQDDVKDIIIIGAGIAGTYIARELARYELNILLLDKENDIANGTTMANSAIIHAGYDAKPGTLKSKFNIEGNKMFDKVCKELDVPFKRCGSLVIGFDEKDKNTIYKLYNDGVKNNIPGLSILNSNEIKKIEPNINKDVKVALYAETAGIISSFELAIALAENAIDNGVECKLEAEVTDIDKDENIYNVKTTKGNFKGKYVINCAGVYADKIARMVGDNAFEIKPRKGHYFVLDKDASKLFKHVIFQCPTEKGKGVLITPTVHGNVLVGPDSNYVNDKDDLATEYERLNEVKEISTKTSDKIPFNKTIRSFVGLRATPNNGDFIIEESKVASGFIHVAGFESPGLSSIPAVAKYVVKMVNNLKKGLVKKKDFNPNRKPVVRFMELSEEEKAHIIKKDRKYGNMICRCESVTEGEIVDCIHRNAGATTIKGVKKRTRPGMGRCQGGFCGPKVVEILARELNLSMDQIIYDNSSSYIITEETKTN